MDLSIVAQKHRDSVRADLRRALSIGDRQLTVEARGQVVREELEKVISAMLEPTKGAQAPELKKPIDDLLFDDEDEV